MSYIIVFVKVSLQLQGKGSARQVRVAGRELALGVSEDQLTCARILSGETNEERVVASSGKRFVGWKSEEISGRWGVRGEEKSGGGRVGLREEIRRRLKFCVSQSRSATVSQSVCAGS